MKLIIKDKNNVPRLNDILECIIYIVAYAIIIFLVSMLLKTIDIDSNYFGLFSLLASLIIYILNKTIKPILFRLTIPITGITMGLFYPCINIIILKINNFILGKHFAVNGIFFCVIVALLISIMNMIMERSFVVMS